MEDLIWAFSFRSATHKATGNPKVVLHVEIDCMFNTLEEATQAMRKLSDAGRKILAEAEK